MFTQAASGLEAIERLSLGQFDAAVLDLNMPDISGIEVLEFVRAQDRLRALPIIVVTTRGDDDSRAQALAAGASEYMTKPFSPVALSATLTELLTMSPTQREDRRNDVLRKLRDESPSWR